MLLSVPGQGHLSAGAEGLSQLPAHSACQVSGWDRAAAKKMSSWQLCGMSGLFFPPLGRGEGLEMLALQPRRIPGRGSGAGMHGLRPHPFPEMALVRRLPMHCEGQCVPRLPRSPRSCDLCAVGAVEVPAGTMTCCHC